MKQQDLFAHFQSCKKITEPLKKQPPSCPNPIISTPKRQPIAEQYSKTFSKSSAIGMLEPQISTTLSQKTTQLLAQLKQNQQPNQYPAQLKCVVANQYSLRERYKELLKDKIELILPVEYKRLLKYFLAIEEGVQMCAMRGQTCWSSSIGDYIQKNCAMKFEIHKIQQIMSVMKVYRLKWGMNEKTQTLELIIEIKGELNRTQRKKLFKEKLLDIVKGYHNEFLKSLNKDEVQMVSKDCWHPKFQVHQVPTLSLAELPEKDTKSTKHYQSVQEFIKANEIKNTKVREILEASAKTRENKENTLISNQPGMQQQKSLGLSDALIAKIKEKERLLNEQKKLQMTTNSKGQFQSSDKERLKNVASIIKTYATMRKVSNIFFVQVIDHIISANKSYLMGKEQICQLIEKLINICPNWLKLINHSQGKILRIEKTDISQILSEIDQHK